ncbi:MAG: SAM-dependent methyltransferase [Sinomonas sp.]|nr:SAM-dependent methyltransferase [Sinomonas sp.]
MDSCCGPRDSGGYDEIFDARFSRAIARRYGRKGLRPAEQHIIRFLTGIGIKGASILEVGGGVGEIQLELLKRGAARAVNLELSQGYEEDAARLIEEAGFGGRIERHLGVDLAGEGDGVEPADVVVLHRVVCCYPDYERLLSAAADHARSALVFSHPPANLPARVFIRMMNGMLTAAGRSFRGYIHPPAAMLGILRNHGFEPVFRWRGPVWRIVGAVRRG